METTTRPPFQLLKFAPKRQPVLDDRPADAIADLARVLTSSAELAYVSPFRRLIPAIEELRRDGDRDANSMVANLVAGAEAQLERWRKKYCEGRDRTTWFSREIKTKRDKWGYGRRVGEDVSLKWPPRTWTPQDAADLLSRAANLLNEPVLTTECLHHYDFAYRVAVSGAKTRIEFSLAGWFYDELPESVRAVLPPVPASDAPRA